MRSGKWATRQLRDQELREYTDPALAITRNNKGFAVPRVGDANPD